MTIEFDDIMLPLGVLTELQTVLPSFRMTVAALKILHKHGMLAALPQPELRVAPDPVPEPAAAVPSSVAAAASVAPAVVAAAIAAAVLAVPQVAAEAPIAEVTPEPVADTFSPYLNPPTAATEAPADDPAPSRGKKPSDGTRPMVYPAPWTAEEERRLVQLKQQGYGWQDIAVKIGRPPEGVKFRWYSKLKRGVDKSPEDVADPATPSTTSFPAAVPTAADLSLPQPVHAGGMGGDREPAPRDDEPVTEHPDGGVIWCKDMTRADIARHLDSLPCREEWPVRADLMLVTAVIRGDGITGAAEQLKVSRDNALHRWHTLLNVVSLDNQRHLVAELQARVAAKAQQQAAK